MLGAEVGILVVESVDTCCKGNGVDWVKAGSIDNGRSLILFPPGIGIINRVIVRVIGLGLEQNHAVIVNGKVHRHNASARIDFFAEALGIIGFIEFFGYNVQYRSTVFDGEQEGKGLAEDFAAWVFRNVEAVEPCRGNGAGVARIFNLFNLEAFFVKVGF